QVNNEFELRLTHQVEELVRLRVTALEQDISRVQREVNEAFTRLLESAESAAALPDANGLVSQITADVNAQIGQASAEGVRLGSDLALLKESVAEMGQQPSQAEVLNTLVARASSFAPRVVLFVVKGNSALGWAARGFDDGVGDSSLRGLSISLQSDTILSVALNAQQTFYCAPDQQTDNEGLIARLGNLMPDSVLGIPLRVRGKAAAVLYSDSADRDSTSVNVEALELLVGTAGIVIELTSLRTRAGEAPAAKPRPQAPAPPQPAAVTPGRTGGPVVQPAQPHPDASRVQQSPQPRAPQHPVEERAAHSAPLPGSTPVAPPPAPPNSGPLRQSFSGEEEKLHSDARKFARLLVSEIKLYNEGKVVEGRRNGDLYERLKEDIDRSRQMYEKRVSPDVASLRDYFYEELVSTLAEGDSAKLGSAFPGPAGRA
ncbi:MAG TPA: hypothetical protein VFV34_17870, partial [Blastocatellia bacterium]|nr:hypothetical protein [Blastocatellia bacterium]